MNLSLSQQEDIIRALEAAREYYDRHQGDALRCQHTAARSKMMRRHARWRTLAAALEGNMDRGGARACPAFKAPIKGIGGLL